MDVFTLEERSRVMASIRSKKNASTELSLILAFREFGITGWRRNYPLFGRPDFVFPSKKVTVFVDGCFWHGCKLHCRMPSTRVSYWIAKVERNRRRDAKVSKALKHSGWRVIRIWEHDLQKKHQRTLRRKISTLQYHGK